VVVVVVVVIGGGGVVYHVWIDKRGREGEKERAKPFFFLSL